jgi:hypothetical protein
VTKSGTSGTTTFNVLLANSGTVQAQSGTILFNRDYTETSSASLVIGLGGIVPGSGYGQIQFSSPTFGGSFNVALQNGFRPSPGDSFSVLGYSSVTGGFTAYYGLDLGGGLKFVPRLDSRAFFLQVSTYSADATPTLSVYRIGDNLLVWWPTAFSNYVTMTTTNLAAPAWTPLSLTGPDQLLISPNQPQQFFRLMK